jgi:hypothetical protein
MEPKVKVGEYQVPLEDFIKAVLVNTRGDISFDIRERGRRIKFETSETRHGFLIKKTLKGMEKGRGLYFRYSK